MPASPRIQRIEWGRIDVETLGSLGDAKLWPGGGREWDWTETKTRHEPGIQVADVLELLEHGAQVVVLSHGMERRLRVQPATVEYLRVQGIRCEQAETKQAVRLYNELTGKGELVAGLFHSTC
jgi:hypothetical protein